MNTTNDFWLIDSNFVGVMRFYKDRDNSDKSIDYMFIEEGIIMGIHGENPPLMKTRKKIVIEEARILWQILIPFFSKCSASSGVIPTLFSFSLHSDLTKICVI